MSKALTFKHRGMAKRSGHLNSLCQTKGHGAPLQPQRGMGVTPESASKLWRRGSRDVCLGDSGWHYQGTVHSSEALLKKPIVRRLPSLRSTNSLSFTLSKATNAAWAWGWSSCPASAGSAFPFSVVPYLSSSPAGQATVGKSQGLGCRGAGLQAYPEQLQCC